MKLADLTQDPKNANTGTFRGKNAVERSLIDCGAGRSIVTDKNGVILAGNKTAQAAQSAGLNEEVILVQTDGSQLVVVQRTDLDASDVKAKTLAVADNRTAELGLEWNPDILKDLSAELDFQPYFSPDELKEIIDPTATAKTPQTMNMSLTYSVIVDCTDEATQGALMSRLEEEGYKCRLLIS